MGYYRNKHKDKKHPASKCRRTRCFTCHPYKVLGVLKAKYRSDNGKE